MVGSGSLISQDQECKALVTSGNTVYLEVYYDQSRSQYFNYGEEFVAEVYINGEPASGVEHITISNKDEDSKQIHYDLFGKRINQSTKGIHVVKGTNSCRKIFVK